MELTSVLREFDRLTSAIFSPAQYRKYRHIRRGNTLGITADEGASSSDINTIARYLAGIMPKTYPGELGEAIALILLVDQSLRYLRFKLFAVDENSIFAPAAAYAALHAQTLFSSDVRYFNAFGRDKQLDQLPSNFDSYSVVFIAGTAKSIIKYRQLLPWSATGIIVRVGEANSGELRVGPTNSDLFCLNVGSLRCDAETWCCHDV